MFRDIIAPAVSLVFHAGNVFFSFFDHVTNRLQQTLYENAKLKLGHVATALKFRVE